MNAPVQRTPSLASLLRPANAPMREWQGRRVWLVGASSGIGQALAAALHAAGARVVVSARNASALEQFSAAHPGSQALPLDVQDVSQVRAAAAQVFAGGELDLVVYCAGHYRAMRATDWSLAEMTQHVDINYVGALHVLDAVLPTLVAQRHGHVSLLGSVAGYRGLPRSLAYGPTKAALIQLCETLYMDLHDLGLGVSIVNPGFVRTPLTAQNDFHMPALVSTEDAAAQILQGWAGGRFEIHFPKRFTWLMKALALLPFPAYQFAIRRFTGL